MQERCGRRYRSMVLTSCHACLGLMASTQAEWQKQTGQCVDSFIWGQGLCNSSLRRLSRLRLHRRKAGVRGDWGESGGWNKTNPECNKHPSWNRKPAGSPTRPSPLNCEWAPYLKQGGEHMKRIHRTGAVWVTHELADVAAPGFFCIITGRGLKCSKDGREEGRGRGRDPPVTFSKAVKDENNHVKKWPSSSFTRLHKF